jgi:putative transposase
MQLVEPHRLDRDDHRFAAIDAAAFASQNLSTAALYLTRQAFIDEQRVVYEQRVVADEDRARDMKTTEPFRALPAKVAQWVLQPVTFACKS